MPVVPVVLIGAFLYTVMTFLKNLSGRNWNGVITQVVAWASGVLTVFLFAQTAFASGVAIGSQTLATLNGWSLLVVGLMASSLFGVTHDGFKAIDNAQTSATPPLVPPKSS